MATEKGKFSTKIGIIAATVGSAIGLGNVWRFPAEAQANGGGAFLLVYICCVLVLGIPVMLAETSLGRAGDSDAVGCFINLTPKKKWWIAGTIGLVASFLILSFYMVVAGWTIEYLFGSITGKLYDGYVQAGTGVENAYFAERMSRYTASTWSPLIWTYVMIGLNLAVLLMGVSKGIEKISNFLMPLLFVLILIFCYASLSLPKAGDGLRFFLMPDFSKVNINVILNALGQAFFSLSLGMGILVTYASYYPKNTKLTSTAVSVSMLDFLMAFLMGLIIFPAVKSFGIGSDQIEGATLTFVTLPEIFAHMGASRLWSTLFFLLLGVAAITSTISIAEVSIAFVRDRFNISRVKSCFLVLVPLIATSTLCSLSLGAVPGLKIAGKPLFDALDTVATNILLPVSALLICIYVGWILPKDFIRNELSNYGTLPTRTAPMIAFLIRYICPVLIICVLVASIISNF